MDGYNRKIILLVLPMVLAVCFSACGGNGGGSANTAKYLVEGKVVKGAVQNASVKIYTLSSHGYRQAIIGEGTTGSDGSFSTQVATTGGPVALVVASGGDYTDEATGQKVTIPSWWEISAVVPWPSDNTKVVLTPLTHMAAEQALSAIAGGENALTSMENAKQSVANSFGLEWVDISKTEPADLTASPKTTMQRGNAAVEYGLVLAALSQITKSEGLLPSQALYMVQNIADDFSDGTINNVGRNGGELPNSLSVTPSHVMSGLKGASNDFLRSSRNASGIGGAESPTYTPSEPSSTPSRPAGSSGGSSGGGSSGGAPTGVAASAGDASVTVSWSAVTDSTSYNVYYSTASGTGKSGTKVSGSASPATVSGLTNGVTYYFVVTSVNSTGESSASSEVSAKPAAACATTFTDSNLASCVSSAVTAYGVTCATSLTNLECINKSISSLSGIEKLTGLTLLNLNKNSIADVSPLASITALQDLTLTNNKITTGVATLATSLVNLKNLVIHCNPANVTGGSCTDTNGTSIPCADLQSLINSATSHGGGMSVVQPSTVSSGVNCS